MSDVIVTEFLVGDQQQEQPVFVGESGESFLDALAEFFDFEDAEWAVVVRGPVEDSFVSVGGDVPVVPGLEKIFAVVDGDAEQPSARVGVAAELIEAAEGLEENVVRGVFGLGGIAEEPEGEVVDRPPVRFVERLPSNVHCFGQECHYRMDRTSRETSRRKNRLVCWADFDTLVWLALAVFIAMDADQELKLTSPALAAPDLSRYCLEKDTFDSRRTLAWVNSICFLYLMIGLFGIKQPALEVNRKPVIADEVVPTVIEPVVQHQVQVVTADSPTDDLPGTGSGGEGGAVVAVTVDSAAVAFSVPTVGNVLVPMGMSQAPPPNPMQAVAPVSSPRLESVQSTGSGGSRPQPLYPLESRKRKEEGKIVLHLEVDRTGRIVKGTIQESSGFPRLDRAAFDYVMKHWFFGPGPEGRQYEAPIVFQLE